MAARRGSSADNAAVSRRDFLYGAAFAVGGVMLAACTGSDSENPPREPASKGSGGGGKGSEPKPLTAPARLKESPLLTQMVEAGDLPPLEERLPTKPYVIPHRWMTTGKYGGDLRLVSESTDGYDMKEYMYGHSPLRWLNDGLDLGPGLAESWEGNDDASEWTFHFRTGLKWSDGQPWSTEDVMFWWEDMVLNEEFEEGVPDEARSGTGTIAELSAPDDTTLVMRFDAPAPMVPEMIANWVNRGIAGTWMEPKHYVKQFHRKYNKNLPANWAETFDQKRNPELNPEAPTMAGWRLKSRQEGRIATFERNPYYWVVDQAGNQLPYIDTLTFRAVDNSETMRLQIQNGQFDFVHGAFVGLHLGDVAGIKETESKNQLDIILWDSGSGTGSMFFFSQDYDEPKMRNLIRQKEFRQALSLGYDRPEVRKAVYFNAGELTTGGYGPKTREFHRGDGPQMYKRWRDSWVDFDAERAKAMLDEIGVVDKDGDGKREMPDGTKLTVRLDYPADVDRTGEHMLKNDLLKKSWDAIGIDTKLNPVAPESFADQWAQGRLMSTTAWETSTLTFGADMLWLMPMEPTRWAPLQGQFYSVRGTPAEKQQQDVDPYKRTPPRMEPEPGGPVERLWEFADKARVETDALARDKLFWEMVQIHIDEGPFFMGAVANFPRMELVKRGLRNVPTRNQTALGGLVNDWHHPMPAAYDPEAWFWDDPASH